MRSAASRTLTQGQARRAALAAQGFADPRPTGAPDARAFRRVLDRMAILQLDSVNVVCRSHYLPVFARLGTFDRARFDRWLWQSGANTEYLAHEASVTSLDVHHLLRFRMRSGRWKLGPRLEAEHPGYVDAVRSEVAERGPLSVSDLRDPGERSGPWWGYSKGKMALEWLYVTGQLAVHHRTSSFVTLYDLPERVVPDEARARPDLETPEAHRRLLTLAAKSLGVATAADLADYFRLKMPVARPLVAGLVADGTLEPVEVRGWNEPAYLWPDARLPQVMRRAALLSPFDPIVWFRPRAERLFGFRYRIEIYVPEPRREYGYYVLPFLLGDRLVARVDLKADRAAGVLLARGVFGEPGPAADEVAPALAAELLALAEFLGLEGVEVATRGDLAPALRSAL